MPVNGTGAAALAQGAGSISSGFNFAAALHNPLMLGTGLLGALTLGRGSYTMETFKENLAVSVIGLLAVAYFAPAWLGIKAAAASVGNAATSVGHQAVTLYHNYVQGPWGNVLNPIIQHESGGVSNILSGGGTLANGSSIASYAATGKASGLVQTIPSTLKRLATKLHIPLNTPYTPDLQVRMGQELAIEKGLLNPTVPAEVVADGLADTWCVAAKPNGLPAPACGTSFAPISFLQSVFNVKAFRQALSMTPALGF